MRQLSPAGQQTIDDIAQRHGFSPDAVMSMLDAVINGNGGMAQFSHNEFSGSGQWMRGGMIMVSDMFNGHLKGRIDALCNELSNLVANQPDLVRSGSFQSQSQGGGGYASSGQQQHSFGGGSSSSSSSSNGFGAASLFVPAPPDWWGTDLRWPDSTGAQNGVRYACFAQARRLAIEVNGRVTVGFGSTTGVKITNSIRYVDGSGQPAMLNPTTPSNYIHNPAYAGNSSVGVISQGPVLYASTIPSTTSATMSLGSSRCRLSRAPIRA